MSMDLFDLIICVPLCVHLCCPCLLHVYFYLSENCSWQYNIESNLKHSLYEYTYLANKADSGVTYFKYYALTSVV